MFRGQFYNHNMMDGMNMESKTISKPRVLGIRYPLSRDPIFVAVKDTSKSIGEILMDTVAALETAGKTHESFQLQQAMNDHVPFVKGQQFSREQSIETVPFQEKILSGENVNYAEVNLLKQHVGGTIKVSF